MSLGAIVSPLTTSDPAPASKPYAERHPAAVDARPTLNTAALDAHSVALAKRQAAVAERKEQERLARVAAEAKRKEEARQAQQAALAAQAEREKQAQAKTAAATQPTPASRQFSASNAKPAQAKPQGQRFEATAYTAFCSTGCTGVTATGLDVSNTIYAPSGRRVIAADPGVLPLGSVVTVTLSNGVSFSAEVADTGGAIRGNRIDILTASKAEAVRFGRQAVTITR